VFHLVIVVCLKFNNNSSDYLFLFRCWLFWSSTVKFALDIFKLNSFVFSNAKDKVHRTIEDELVEAFVKVDAIPQAHADDMSKVGFFFR